MEEQKLRQLFKNRSNCYVDTDDVVQGMDENCFIETVNEALRLHDVVKNEVAVCDCVIPKPKDPYHDLDRKICRDCNGNIEQTDL
jgi:hypothetical protein